MKILRLTLICVVFVLLVGTYSSEASGNDAYDRGDSQNPAAIFMLMEHGVVSESAYSRAPEATPPENQVVVRDSLPETGVKLALLIGLGIMCFGAAARAAIRLKRNS